VDVFKRLLQFRTVSAEGPVTGAYSECIAWLDVTVNKFCPGVTTLVVTPIENKPILVATLLGEDPSLESVVLNAHYDVVPAMEDLWTVDPWAAGESEDGKIYGRGTQDMKIVLAQYIIALSNLVKSGKKCLRTVHMTFVPDEEIGGKDGMGEFIKQGHFKSLLGEVGVVLDEGLANEDAGKYTVFYGERCPLWVLVESKGPTGHGSRFIPNTAVEKLIGVANKAFEKRREQEILLGRAGGCKHCEALKLGDVLTINLTALKAGVTADGGKTFSINVIPTDALAGFDIRVPVTTPVSEVTAMLDEWTKEEGLSWRFDPNTGEYQDLGHQVSSVDAQKCKWWASFSNTCSNLNLDLKTEIFPAGTDSRFVRQLNIPAFGFSPMTGTPILLHEHDEYVERKVFLQGIPIYEALIYSLANVN